MPRVVRVAGGETPLAVIAATQAFGSELRIRLIRHFAERPGSQADAARALGVITANVARNTRLLVDLGVITETRVNNTARFEHGVDQARVNELTEVLRTYLASP